MASTPTAPPTRKPYHHGDLHRALLEVAHDEIATKGATAVSMASLARAAGVSQAAPYRHFADREALLAEVAAGGFRELAARLSAASGDADPIRGMAQAYVAFGEQNTELYRLMFASRLVPQAGDDSDLGKAADEALAPLLDALAQRDPGGETRVKAAGVWAQVHGLVMLKADGFIREPIKLTDVLGQVGF